MTIKNINIITDKVTGFKRSSYLLNYLAIEWARNGYSITLSGPKNPPNADLGILHVDMTVVSQDFLDACSAYPVLLNGQFTDNSKRLISKHVISPDCNYSGAVIIKTNANYGGLHELRAKYPAGYPDELVAMHPNNSATQWSLVQHIPTESYIVLESIDAVHEEVWTNPYLVVEKFTPEIDADGLYCMRACLFFGDEEVGLLVKSRSKIIKGRDVIDLQFISGIAPTEVQQFKKDHHMEFGRIDYVIHRGEVVIFDANKTASLSQTSINELSNVLIKPLSQGISNYV
jgi:hypothetical protein